MAKSAAERKRKERESMRSYGFVLRQVWIHPKDWKRAKAYLQRLMKKHWKPVNLTYLGKP